MFERIIVLITVLAFAVAALAQLEEPPVSDLAPEPTDQSLRQLRAARNLAFDESGRGQRPLDESISDPHPPIPFMIIHRLPAPELPFERSDLVAVGDVIGVQSYLSGNRGTLYTEYIIRPSEVIAATGRGLIQPDGNVCLIMEGGALRLATGRVIKLSPRGFHLWPDVGTRHVFFLSYRAYLQGYFLTKSWQIKDGYAIPQSPEDIAREEKGTSLYAGMPELAFIGTLQSIARGQ